MNLFDYQQHNRRAWNRLAKIGNRFAAPAKDSDFTNPLASVDGPGWIGPNISGKRVLCLAAGGGRQGPLYAAAGALVTVVDISSEMLELDRRVSQRRQLNVRTVETSMEDLSMFSDASFDFVIQPVSSCYVPDLEPVYREVARVTVADGIYISQHKQPASLQTSLQPNHRGYSIQHESNINGPLPNCKTENLVREPGAQEFIHSWQDLIGKMCHAGFVVEDVLEPDHADISAAPGTFEHRSRFVPPYVRFKARRTHASNVNANLWSPGDD